MSKKQPASYESMVKLALSSPEVVAELNRERVEAAHRAFSAIPSINGLEDDNWMEQLAVSEKGGVLATSANVALLLNCDPALKGRIYMDSFADTILGLSPLPWGNRPNESGVFNWRDADDDGLQIYLENYFKRQIPNIIMRVLNDHLARNSFNPVQEYLNAAQWDGAPRLDTLFINYLGAEDTPYTRAVTRKAFVAAVARAMTPGCKYDTMLILSGPQGIGKSTLLAKMGGPWFTDSLRTFEGKDAYEVIQGMWLVEIAELQAFSNSDVNRVKQFLSSTDDRYRVAYGRRTESHKRRCVFFGTTNAKEFLRDPTGGRRFWPVYTGIQPPIKNVFQDLDGERDQIWAEARIRWEQGETLFLPSELWSVAAAIQESAREVDPREGLILDFLEKPIPKDWDSWSLDRRRVFWSGSVAGDMELVPRKSVCAMEIWCELFGGTTGNAEQRNSRLINSVLDKSPDWTRDGRRYFYGYGLQRGFRRVSYDKVT